MFARFGAMLLLFLGIVAMTHADYVRMIYTPPMASKADKEKDKDKDDKDKDADKDGPFPIDRMPSYDATRGVAYVPYKKMQTKGGGNYNEVDHFYGKSYLAPTSEIQLDYAVMAFPAALYERDRKRWQQKPEVASGEELARVALSLNLLPQFHALMGEIAALDSEKKTLNYAPPNKLAPAERSESAEFWARQLRLTTLQPSSARYVLLHNFSGNQAPEVVRIHQLLEDQYQLVLQWFTMRGQTVSVPKPRVCAILYKNPNEFAGFQKTFDSPRLNWDGFVARREGIVAMCGTPLDDVYSHLNRELSTMWTSGWNREELLKGQGMHADVEEKTNLEMSTKALLQKKLLEDAWLATVSHNATRQLLGSFGFVPPSVHAPEWILDGLACHFETPKGAPWPGTGLSHWFYLPMFKEWLKDPEPAEQALIKVVTDEYYREALQASDPTEQRLRLMKARVLSWSLAYYLSGGDSRRWAPNAQFDGLMRYFQELNSLPRDLQFPPEIHARCFARAFNLTQSDTKDEFDPAKVRTLAAEWYRFLEFESLDKQRLLVEGFQKKPDKPR